MISDKCEERILKIESSEMPYWVYGNTKNPKVFYLHGFAHSFSENSGDLPIRYLMENYCVIAFDLPGWGKSKNIKISVNHIIDKIAQNISIKKFILFGTSYGGALSLLYALSNPERLHGVIIAGVPKFGLMSLPSIYSFSTLLSPKKVHVLKELFGVGRNSKNIRVPVLLLYSKNDRIAPVSQGNYYAKRIPNSHLVVINGQNHGWLLHRIIDNDFGREVEKFLKNYS